MAFTEFILNDYTSRCIKDFKSYPSARRECIGDYIRDVYTIHDKFFIQELNIKTNNFCYWSFI